MFPRQSCIVDIVDLKKILCSILWKNMAEYGLDNLIVRHIGNLVTYYQNAILLRGSARADVLALMIWAQHKERM